MNKVTKQFRNTLREFEREIGFQNNNCCNTGISMVQCHLLLDIEQNPETSIKEIAERQNLDKSTISRTVDGLFNIGLINREPNPESRRQTLISLNNNGKNACCNINNINDSFFGDVFNSLSDEEVNCFNKVFRKVTDKMTEIRLSNEDETCCS